MIKSIYHCHYTTKFAILAVVVLLLISVWQNAVPLPSTGSHAANESRWKIPANSIVFGLDNFKNSAIDKAYDYNKTEEAMRKGPVDFKCKDSRPVGKSGFDAYYVCFDEPHAPIPGNCLVYSFGIDNRFDFDDEMASKYKCQVFSFDPSMKDRPYQRKSGVQFYNWGIASEDGWYVPTGNEVFKSKNPDGKWLMKTLKTIIKELNHENKKIDVLKIDTEGAEVKSLGTALRDGSLQRYVSQLTMEWHLFRPERSHRDHNNNTFGEVVETFEMLQAVGFKAFRALRRSLGKEYRPVESYMNVNFR